MSAIAAGVNHACHFYNAMTPLNQREPGAVVLFDPIQSPLS